MEEDVKVPFGAISNFLSNIAEDKMLIKSTKVTQKVLGMLIVVCGLTPRGNGDTFAEKSQLT